MSLSPMEMSWELIDPIAAHMHESSAGTYFPEVGEAVDFFQR